MKRIAVLMAIALLVPASLTFAQAKTKTHIGNIKAVTADSLTVTGKDDKDMVFVVDTTTKVIAKGGSHKAAAAKDAGKPLMITDTVKEGQRVRVKYHDVDGKMHAAEVRVQ